MRQTNGIVEKQKTNGIAAGEEPGAKQPCTDPQLQEEVLAILKAELGIT